MLLEVVCCTPADCEVAEANGAGRIELCTALEVGGVTPTRGLVREARRATRLPIVAMLRVRGGSFVYTKPEMDAMIHDLECLLAEDIQGVVFWRSPNLWQSRCRVVSACMKMVTDRTLVFHRAFDHAKDLDSAWNAIAGAGFHRVLTSGRAASAMEGIDVLAELQKLGTMEVLPGGGVRLDNVDKLVRQTDCRQVHMAPRKLVHGNSVLDGEHVRAVASLLQQ